MARRRLVSLEIWARHYGAPLDEREIARHYTLTSDDLEIVGRRRGDATRLGYAMLMLYMRWPGRALEAGEVPPAPVLAYVGLSALLGHGYTVDNRAQPEMATFGVFRRRVPPIAMQNRRLPLDHWGQVVVRSDFR